MNANFDVFIEIAKEARTIEADVTNLNQIIGPLMAMIYSSSVYKQISSFEAPKKKKEDDLEASVANFHENKREIFKKSSSNMLGRANTRKSEMEERFETGFLDGFDRNDMGRTAFHLRDTDEGKEDLDESQGTSSINDTSATGDNGESSNTFITVFAATYDDISNCTVNYKELIDFMLEIRDENLELREEIDNYMEKNDLKPSQEYEHNRVVPDISEITEIIKTTKISKNYELNSQFQLSLDLKRNKRQCKAFMKEVSEYQMPKIHSLTLKNIHKIEPNDFQDYLQFMRHTMASEIREFHFHSGNEIALGQFNHSISNLLTLVNYQTTFSHFILTDEDMTNVFLNLTKCKHVVFESCISDMVSSELNLSSMAMSHLESITISMGGKKGSETTIMSFLNILCYALYKTPVKKTLASLKVPKILNISKVKSMFKDRGYKLTDIQ